MNSDSATFLELGHKIRPLANDDSYGIVAVSD